MLESLLRLPTCWEQLQKTNKPVVMYGMGNGADHILRHLDRMGVSVCEFFASDSFVRGHSFHGKRVKKLSEIQSQYKDFVIVTAFAVQDAPTMDAIFRLDRQYELYAPDVPVAGDELFDRDFLDAHLTEAQAAYDLLADENSRQIYRDLIAYKLTGKIAYLASTASPREEAFSSLLRLGSEESYVDLGAYNGDTLEEFFRMTGGQFASVDAMEPDAKNFRKLCDRAQRLGIFHDNRVRLWNLAAWDDRAQLSFAVKAGRSSSVSADGRKIPADSVDNLMGRAPVTFLKMDVEGSETHALLGAANTIRRHKPKLMISAYHRSEDLFALALQLQRIQPGYRLYLRRFPYIPAWEINLIGLWEG
ncbi:MAG TPA: FkbM family methyltransferase [Ruminococcaceae bacterium]|nr:FkbM family methyltransferase [Oscillospiraceae bacterium]MDD5921033.1 FkbM family methyltransferase [Oscillospiraceae bacterium]HCB65267.1 FkbM family methyltransferase [Oscillospiraceae bacterium]HCU32864.1 FkbM family methyltransferase [Oscillospiraceae bacterium]